MPTPQYLKALAAAAAASSIFTQTSQIFSDEIER
jgi:hypothetical protein